jgi:hypothetical protein
VKLTDRSWMMDNVIVSSAHSSLIAAPVVVGYFSFLPQVPCGVRSPPVCSAVSMPPLTVY